MIFNKRFVFFLLIIISCIGLTSFITNDEEWKLKKYGNGVAVYNREIPNTIIKELKAETQIKTSLSSIIALLNDRETYPDWVYRCGKSMMIKKISDSEGMYYQTVVAPWPVDNRDFVVDVKVVQDSKTKVVKQFSTCMPNYISPIPDHVRITEFDALWTLTPLKNGLVKCEYQLLVNPGGNVPAWLVNLAAIDGPYETTVNLKERVMKEKYQKAKFSFIKEPE
jgi:hypothetical protein